jgi:chromosome segregation ATPase
VGKLEQTIGELRAETEACRKHVQELEPFRLTFEEYQRTMTAKIQGLNEELSNAQGEVESYKRDLREAQDRVRGAEDAEAQKKAAKAKRTSFFSPLKRGDSKTESFEDASTSSQAPPSKPKQRFSLSPSRSKVTDDDSPLQLEVARLTAAREELQRRVDELEMGEAEELRMAREQRIADLEAELAAANAKLAQVTADKPDAFAAQSPTPKPKRFSVFGGGAAKPKSKGAESFGDDDTLISTVARLREVQEELNQANTAKGQLEEALDRQTKWKEHFEAQVEQLKQGEDAGARLAREERIRALEAELAQAQAAKLDAESKLASLAASPKPAVSLC